MPECTCPIPVGEVHDGLCLRCRKPTNRRATAAFVSSSAIEEAPAQPDPNRDQRTLEYVHHMVESERERLRKAELLRKFKHR